MKAQLSLALLLLSACLAVAEDAGVSAEGGNRRLLITTEGPPKSQYTGPAYPKECKSWGEKKNGYELARCCYRHGYKDENYIHKICQGFGASIDIRIIVEIIVGYSGPYYPRTCFSYGRKKDGYRLSKCVYDAGITNYNQIYKICKGFKINITVDIIKGYFRRKYTGPPVVPEKCKHWGYDGKKYELVACCYSNGVKEPDTIYNVCKGYGIDIDIKVIIKYIIPLGYKPKPKYTGPPVVPEQCTQYGYPGSKNELVSCCYKFGVKEPQIIYDVCKGYSIDIQITIIIDIITPLGYHPPPPNFPPQCTKWANKGNYKRFVKCCKKANKPPKDIVVYCKTVPTIKVDITIQVVEQISVVGPIEDAG